MASPVGIFPERCFSLCAKCPRSAFQHDELFVIIAAGKSRATVPHALPMGRVALFVRSEHNAYAGR